MIGTSAPSLEGQIYTQKHNTYKGIHTKEIVQHIKEKIHIYATKIIPKT